MSTFVCMFLGMSVYILNVYIPFRNALRKDEPVHWDQVPRLLRLGGLEATKNEAVVGYFK